MVPLKLTQKNQILHDVPVISRGTVDSRPIDRAVPSEVWKYKTGRRINGRCRRGNGWKPYGVLYY
jgi:hypothetical protein